MLRKQIVLLLFLYSNAALVSGQSVADSSLLPETDIDLRIVNLNPYFSLHVDSMLSYQLAINKDEKKYYWFLHFRLQPFFSTRPFKKTISRSLLK